MSDTPSQPDPRIADVASERRRLARRRVSDKGFMVCTIAAVLTTIAFIAIFIGTLLYQGLPALRQAEIKTTVTYQPDTVKRAKLAFPEEIRDFVSRTRIREIPREGSKVKLKLPVDLDAATTNPSDGLTDITLELSEFPRYLTPRVISEPVRIPREMILRFIGPDGLDVITDAINQGQTGTQELWLWASQEVSDEMQFGNALAEVDAVAITRLNQAKRTQKAFNTLAFGDGLSREEWVLASADVDQYLKGYANKDPRQLDDPTAAPLSIEQAEQLDKMLANGDIRLAFNQRFFFNGDSNQPEAAGIFPAVWGSIMVLLLVFVLSVPIGVLTSIYLEEFAPDNWLTQTIEVNINNLAAVPSILFGVLGLATLINFLGMPRSSALVGGATLTLMTLPVVIISSRAALRAVPDSIRRAAYATGATRWQVVIHHVLPLAVPGIMTGAIIGIAQAMGETAPLIIIGLIAFVPDAASSVLDPTTVMPAQIFSWWSNNLTAFNERAALMILVLLVVLFFLNALAVLIRARFEKQW